MEQPVLRCTRGEKCSIRSHNHENENIASFLGLNERLINFCNNYRVLFKHPQSHYIRIYNSLCNDSYDKEFIIKVLSDYLKEATEPSRSLNLTAILTVFLYRLFNSSYNLRWFILGNISKHPKFISTIREKFIEHSRLSLFSDHVPALDIAQDFYERMTHYYSLEEQEDSYFARFKQNVVDADNIFTEEILSFI